MSETHHPLGDNLIAEFDPSDPRSLHVRVDGDHSRIALTPRSFRELLQIAARLGPSWLGVGGAVMPPDDPREHLAHALRACFEKPDDGPSLGFKAGFDFGAGVEQVAFSIGQQIRRGYEAG